MRNPDRILIILEEIKKLWEKYPDQRLGQVLENYVFFAGERGDKTSCALFYQEDDETLEILKATLKKGIQNPMFKQEKLSR